MCVEQLESTSLLESFVVCRLIPLDKKHGLRLTGVEEVLGRLGGKVVMTLFKDDVTQDVGALQLSAEQDVGVEAAVHAMYNIFSEENTEAVLKINATNAFISINPKIIV